MSDGDIVEKLVIEGDSSEAQQAADDMESHLTASFAKSLIGVEALKEGLHLAMDVLKDSIDLSIQHEGAINQQAAALRALGDTSGQWSAALREQAEQLQGVTGIAADHITKLQTMAVNYGVSSDKVGDFIKASTELANVTGRDVNETMMSLIRAQDGVIDRNMRLVPGVADLTKEQLLHGDAVKMVNEKWGDYLGLKLQGTGGAIQQAKLDMEDLEKTIGSALIPTLGNLAKTMMSLWKGEHGETGLGFFEQIARWEAAAIGWDAKVDQLTKLGESRLDAMKNKAEETSAALAGLTPVGGDHPDLSKGAKGKKGIQFGDVSEMDWLKQEQLDADQKASFAEGEYDTLAKIEEKFYRDKQKRLDDALAGFEKDNELEDKAWKKTHEERAKEDKKLQEAMAHEHKVVTDQIAHGMESMAMVGLNALEQLVQGNKISADQIAKDMLGGLGKTLVADGSKNMIMGLAKAISSYGADATAYALMATGAEELVGGLALEAGTAWVFGGSSGAGAAGSGGSPSSGNGGASAYQGSQATGAASSQPGNSQQRQITIVVDGNLSPAETGAWIQKALNKAQGQGLIG